MNHFVLPRLMRMIQDRQEKRPAGSYTTELFDAGPKRIGAKVREEADELAEAICAGSEKEIVHEAADLVYHTLVAVASGEVDWEEVERELQRRFGISGLEEKASRKKPD